MTPGHNKTYFNSCLFAVTYAAGFALRAWPTFDKYADLDNLIPFICSVCRIAITPFALQPPTCHVGVAAEDLPSRIVYLSLLGRSSMEHFGISSYSYRQQWGMAKSRQ